MPVDPERALHYVATRRGLHLEWVAPFGYCARFPGSRARFTLGRTPGRALARLTVALQAMPLPIGEA